MIRHQELNTAKAGGPALRKTTLAEQADVTKLKGRGYNVQEIAVRTGLPSRVVRAVLKGKR
jgi:hypothetical protein